jgi:small subunit ribosomal protein S6e
MKLNIGYSVTSCNKTVAVEDENKLRSLYDKRIGQEVDGGALGEEYKGYIFKITGGCDKAGFPMKQGVLTTSRVRLLIPKGELGFQRWRGRAGERRRKSVRGCIISGDIAVANLVIVKKGDAEIEGLTDKVKPRTLGPKRASKLRKLFNLSKSDDVRKFVIKHKVTIGKKTKEPTIIQRGPKIQRLITPERIRRKVLVHKRTLERAKDRKQEKTVYERLLSKRKKEWEAEKNKKVKVEEPKKVETKKVEPTKKVEEPKKTETKKVEPTKKVEEKKSEKKPETKKVEEKKPETKKVEPKKEEKKPETKKVEPKKEEKKPEPKKEDPKKKTTKK